MPLLTFASILALHVAAWALATLAMVAREIREALAPMVQRVRMAR